MSTEAFHKLSKNPNRNGIYSVQITADIVLDCYEFAKDKKCLASKANDVHGIVSKNTSSRKRPTTNARIVVSPKNQTARLKATRTIRKNEEILTDYGTLMLDEEFNLDEDDLVKLLDNNSFKAIADASMDVLNVNENDSNRRLPKEAREDIECLFLFAKERHEDDEMTLQDYNEACDDIARSDVVDIVSEFLISEMATIRNICCPDFKHVDSCVSCSEFKSNYFYCIHGNCPSCRTSGRDCDCESIWIEKASEPTSPKGNGIYCFSLSSTGRIVLRLPPEGYVVCDTICHPLLPPEAFNC